MFTTLKTSNLGLVLNYNFGTKTGAGIKTIDRMGSTFLS